MDNNEGSVFFPFKMHSGSHLTVPQEAQVLIDSLRFVEKLLFT